MHSLALAAALATISTSVAQDSDPEAPEEDAQVEEDVEDVTGTNIEDRGTSLETQDTKFKARVFFETEWHEYNNLDFRRLDESSDQAILDSDDRNGFAFTGIALDLGYQIEPSTRLVFGTSYRGLWGNDQLGNVNAFGGFLYFNSLFVEYEPVNWKYKPRFRVGRQRFDLGGLGGTKDYILADTLDMVRIDFPLGKIGTLITVPVNLMGLSAENDDVNFVSYAGQTQTQIFGFRGDRMSRRHGLVLHINPEALSDFDLRGYAFYTDMGALGSGSDISYGGRLGNFSDNDWVFNAGGRVSYTFLDALTPYAAIDVSTGIDRKELVTNDVNTNGLSWAGGLAVDVAAKTKKDFGVTAELGYFEAQGPVYQDNGQLYSHGYVGMKGRQVGGLLADRFLGWHPSAYVGSFGIEDMPQETSRKSGTRVVNAEFELDFPGPVNFGAGFWFMQDTGLSVLNPADIDTITPPFGYSTEEYRAQSRLGKVLGYEIDGFLRIRASKHFGFHAYGAVLLPGPYYAQEIGRIAGTALGSSDPQPMWDAGAGTSVRF